MKRESRGQQVKTFKHHEPQPDLSYKEVIGKVYFDAKSGDFMVYAPEHIAAVADVLIDKNIDLSSVMFNKDGVVRGKQMDSVLTAYTHLRVRFEALMRDQQRVRVIVVDYESALHVWDDAAKKEHADLYRPRERFAGHGHAPPMLGLRYKILYQVGDKLYQEIINRAFGDHPESRHLQYKSSAKGAHIVPWTQEREDFFAAVVDRLEQLIMRIDIFMHDLGENVDLAIEDMHRHLALPAPSKAAE